MAVDPMSMLAEATRMLGESGQDVLAAFPVTGQSSWPPNDSYSYMDSLLVATATELVTFKAETKGTFKKQTTVKRESTFRYAEISDVRTRSGVLWFEHAPQSLMFVTAAGDTPQWQALIARLASSQGT